MIRLSRKYHQISKRGAEFEREKGEDENRDKWWCGVEFSVVVWELIIELISRIYRRCMTFRSIPMAHFRLFLPRQNYYQSVEELLSMGKTHIVDIGSPLTRPFFNQQKRVDELLIKIRTMMEALKEKGIVFEQYNEQDPDYMADLERAWRNIASAQGAEKSKLLDYYDQEIQRQWESYLDKKNGLDRLKSNQKAALSKIACFEAMSSFFGESMMLGGAAIGGQKGISAIVGVIDPAVELKFSRTVYRVSRGFAFFKSFSAFRFEGLQHFYDKVVILVYPNSSSGVLEKKLARIMETFAPTMFHFNEGDKSMAGMQASVRQYQEVMNLINLNERQMNQFLDSIANRHSLQTWRTYLWRQKLIYETLNKMILRDHFLVADAYVPMADKKEMVERIKTISPSPEVQELTVTKPPTAFDTNCYTAIAQEITDTYGVPRYEEINPAIFTTVTFPFFFGVMFGDIGHGLILFLFGLYLVFNNKALEKTSFSFVCQLRYMVLMMGFFAFYCGWIYNDFLGMNLNIFGSCYPSIRDQITTDQYVSPKVDCIYPFGIDPIWGVSNNELIFVNGLKMKISVIIAIVHMCMGVVLKFLNAAYFKRTLEIVFEFIPQILFLGLLFGWMDFLIIFKWLTPWPCEITGTPLKPNSGIFCDPVKPPPSIISTMMDIGLQVGSTEKAGAMWQIAGNSSQDTFQVLILLVAFICVPMMLIPKPCIEISRLKKVKKDHPLLADQLDEDQKVNNSERSLSKLNPNNYNFTDEPEKHEEEHDTSEIFVHQLIETIEYVLGAISNTASYLRLWALSLAHSQLAKVFFQKTLEGGYTMEEMFLAIPAMVIFFYILVWVTFGILMCMDTMECFLHSLRLHWVQFQNKFYKGDGYKFEPLSFRTFILHSKQEHDK